MIPAAIIQMDSKHSAILIVRSFLVISFFISLPLATHPRQPRRTRQPKREVSLSISSARDGCSFVKRKRGLDTCKVSLASPHAPMGCAGHSSLTGCRVSQTTCAVVCLAATTSSKEVWHSQNKCGHAQTWHSYLHSIIALGFWWISSRNWATLWIRVWRSLYLFKWLLMLIFHLKMSFALLTLANSKKY